MTAPDAAVSTAASPAASAPPQAVEALGSTVDHAVRTRRYSRMSLALIILASIALLTSLHFARAFFVPLLIGILISYALHPLVDWLGTMRMPRPAAAALVLGALIGGFSWVGYALSGQATVLIEKLPEAARKLRLTLASNRGAAPTALQNVQEAASELQRAANDVGQKAGVRAAPTPVTVSSSSWWLRDYALAQSTLLISIAAQTPIVLLLAYFLLASGDHFRRKLVQFVGPSLSTKKDALRILGEIDTQVQRYLFVILATNTLVAIGTWLAFEALGLEQAGVWGVFAGVLHFIPYLGTVLLALAAGVAGYLQFGTLTQAAAVAGTALLVAGIISLSFTTWLHSRYARVNAAVLFIALLFFAWLWGAAGLLLGAPLVAIAKVICDRVESLHPAGELLGH